MELAEAVTTRRSIRKFLDKDVPDDVLLRAFELARWAPSGGNFQSWKFLVLKNGDMIKRAADAAQAKIDMLTRWPEATRYEDENTLERVRNNSTFFRHAPVLIVVLSQDYKSIITQVLSRRGKKDPLAKEMMQNRRSASTRVQEIGGFVAQLLLILHSMGLGACWITGSLIAKREIEEILEVPQGWDLMALIPVGYPAESLSKTRKSVEEIVVFVR